MKLGAVESQPTAFFLSNAGGSASIAGVKQEPPPAKEGAIFQDF